MSDKRVLICGDIIWAHDEVKQMFNGLATTVHMDSPDRASFLANSKYDNIVGVYRHNSSADHIGVFDKEIIGFLSSKGVKWIAHNGAGYDQIDIAECKAQGITVSNTPGAVDAATATTALFLLLSCLRQYSRGERSLRALTWKPSDTAPNTHDPQTRVLAILGLGGIGMKFAEYCHAFPMRRILYHNRNRVQGAPEWLEYCENVEDMLKQADILSVHVPLRKETEGLVGEKWIRLLKKGSIIINTARGKVIDEDAVIRALEDGHLSSVGLDVFPNEPEVNPRLLEFPQCALLPHMGTENQDSQRDMEVRALTNLHDYLTKGKGSDIVPELRGVEGVKTHQRCKM